SGALQSGLVYGFAGQGDGIVGGIRGEVGAEAPVIGTGGLVDLIAPHSRAIGPVEPFLTLGGLGIVWVLQRCSAHRRLRTPPRWSTCSVAPRWRTRATASGSSPIPADPWSTRGRFLRE